MFDLYLDNLPQAERQTLEDVINTAKQHVPEATEGTSYGMPAFKYKGRPLLGFSSTKRGLSLYPFDPLVILELQNELTAFETGKGVIRFTADQPIPKQLILLLLDLRVAYLDR